MKRLLFINLAIALQGTPSALGSFCPDTADPSVPVCPEVGLLSEQYPIAAVVVSDHAMGSSFVVDYLKNIFRSHGDQAPLAYAIVKEENRAEIERQIRAAASTPAQGEAWVKRLRYPPGPKVMWHQDYFDSFHDPETGKPQLRFVDGYRTNNSKVRGEGFKAALPSMNEDCGVTEGAPLVGNGGYNNAKAGGNLEAVGDFCLIGRGEFASDEDLKTYAQSVCGGLENFVETPSQFLLAGHTDEFFKTIPIPGKAAPCNFALAIASPAKALELLEQNKSAPAFDRFPAVAVERGVLKDVCEKMTAQPSAVPPIPQGPANKGSGGQSQFSPLFPLFFEVAVAETSKPHACSRKKNGDLLRFIQGDSELRTLNEQVESRMQGFIGSLKSRISAKYPGCDPPVVKVPQLFYGAGNFDGAKSRSIFPNPTNGEYSNGHYLLPDPLNDTLGNGFRRELSALGVTQSVIDTQIAHRNTGNLHCLTHAIRYCRPRGGSR